MGLIFKKCQIKEWQGRYARVPGESTVFKVKSVDGVSCPVLLWKTEDGVGTCRAIESADVREMTLAILAGKRKFGGGGGGAFVINEFGQVLVPASDGSGQRAIVGAIKGRLRFNNPFQDNSFFDISNDSGLSCGDLWNLPYVGVPYNLSKRSEIYFYRQTDDGGTTVKPSLQDEDLVSKLRSIRRYGAMRFVVNPFGIVMTKQPKDAKWSRNEEWEPIYVGRINNKAWFSKES